MGGEVARQGEARPMKGWTAHWMAGLGFGLLVLALFVDVLLGDDAWVPSHAQGDTARYFAYIRNFGYSELSQGNIPLWTQALRKAP